MMWDTARFRAIADSLWEIQERGLDVEFTPINSDTAQRFKAIAGETGYPLHPQLDPIANSFSPANAFFLFAKDGEVDVATLGCKLEDIGDTDIRDFWLCELNRLYAPNQQPALLDSMTSAELRLGGRLAYLGAMYVRRSHRRQVPIETLARVAVLNADYKWAFDHAYGFVTARTGRLGLGVLYGGQSCFERALHWREDFEAREPNDFLIKVSRSEFRRTISRLFCDAGVS